jgi:hypothetical protein
MKIKATSESPSRSVALTSISTLLSASISAYQCLPPPLRIVHFSIEAFRWCIAVKATLRGIYEMLSVGWMPHQPSPAFDDVMTPVFDRPLVVVIPSHILEGVLFPLPESLNIWHASHKLLDAIHVFEVWETRSGVVFLQHIVIVRLHTPLLDPTLDIFVLCMCRKRVVAIILEVRLKVTLSVAFPWLSNVIAQRTAGARVCFRLKKRRWRWVENPSLRCFQRLRGRHTGPSLRLNLC